MPSVALIWADSGYAGRLVAYARRVLRRTVEVVRKKPGQRGAALPAAQATGSAATIMA